MAKSGIEMMLGAMGIDASQLVGDFSTLKKTVTETLATIDNRLSLIERQNDLILRAFRMRMGEEVWTALQTMQENTPQLRQLQQSLPNQPQTSQQEKQ